MKPGSLDRTFAEGHDWPAIVAAPSKVEYNPPQPGPNKVYAYVILNKRGEQMEMVKPESGLDWAQTLPAFYSSLWPDNAPHTLHTLYISP